MFEGGTNFGFFNGGSGFQSNGHYYPVFTSYDYDAPLTESGLVTYSESDFLTEFSFKLRIYMNINFHVKAIIPINIGKLRKL